MKSNSIVHYYLFVSQEIYTGQNQLTSVALWWRHLLDIQSLKERITVEIILIFNQVITYNHAGWLR